MLAIIVRQTMRNLQKAMCRLCHKNIEQGELRLALMLQDEEGYKNTAWMHFDCFWKHPETRKLDGTPRNTQLFHTKSCRSNEVKLKKQILPPVDLCIYFRYLLIGYQQHSRISS